MKIISLLFALFLGTTVSYAQELYLVKLKQKENTSTYLSNPSQMLSQKALDRRTKYSIALDEKDVPISVNRIKQIKQLNLNYIGATKWLNTVMVEITNETTLQNLRNLSFVESVTTMVQNSQGSYKKHHKIKWTDLEKNSTNYEYGSSSVFIKQLNVNLLHEKNILGQGVHIAVIDAGFPKVNTLSAFEILRKENRIFDTYDFVENKKNVYGADSHGTMVLSTMAAEVDGTYIGTAPKAIYSLYRSEDNYSETPNEMLYWIQAVERADSVGVDMINTSLGYSTFDDSRYDYTFNDMDGKTTLISRGAIVAQEKGIFVVVSAGNDGNNDWKRVAAPADVKEVFSVGANRANKTAASFSSYGPNALGEIKPNVSALGENIEVYYPSGDLYPSNGTSFSGPVTTGAVALIFQQFPKVSHHILKDKIQQTGHLYVNPSQQLGYGIPDYAKASEDLLFVSELTKNSSIKVYPNPFSNELTIQSQEKIESIEIYNLVGEKLISSNRSTSISTSQLKAGVYLIKIKVADGTILTEKIMKK